MCALMDLHFHKCVELFECMGFVWFYVSSYLKINIILHFSNAPKFCLWLNICTYTNVPCQIRQSDTLEMLYTYMSSIIVHSKWTLDIGQSTFYYIYNYISVDDWLWGHSIRKLQLTPNSMTSYLIVLIFHIGILYHKRWPFRRIILI